MLNNFNSQDPAKVSSSKNHWKVSWSVLIAASALLSQTGCSSTSWAMIGAGIWSVGWPIGAVAWAGIGEWIGANHAINKEKETQIRPIFDQIPQKELQSLVAKWPTDGVLYINRSWRVHVIPESRKGNIITFKVNGFSNDNKSLGTTMITYDISGNKK